MKRIISASILDQMLISALMFAINLLLIGQAGAESFGRFIVVLAAFLLSFGAQNALILLPLNVLIPGKPEHTKTRNLRMLATVDIAVVGTATMVVAAIVGLLGFGIELVCASAALVVSGSNRELMRTVFLTQNRASRYLAMDVTVIAATVCALPVTWTLMAPETACIVSLAFGNLVGAAAFGTNIQRTPRRLKEMVRRYGDYWTKSRWALAGAVVTDAQMRFYIFAVEILRGSATLGLLQAGRVLVNPIAMLAFAWARAIRPNMAERLNRGDRDSALSMMKTGMLLIMGIGVVYLTALNLAWPLLDGYFLKGRYPGLYSTLMLWSVFALLNVPAICVSIYLQAGHKYRQLTICGALSATGSCLLLGLLAFDVPSLWAICALLVGELIMLAGLFKVMRTEFSGATEHDTLPRPAL
ncbi:MAG: hypothetical protein HKN05_09335 [Rhizobiales bacterium]|nr:hypothetical protein [Hyphomicrobiales bacterium]